MVVTDGVVTGVVVSGAVVLGHFGHQAGQQGQHHSQQAGYVVGAGVVVQMG